jgi:uncharacterized membrane protein (UPF0182 family)
MGVTLDDALAKLFRKQPPKRAEGRLGEIAAREEAAAIAPSASAKTLIERALELDAEAQNLLRQGDLAGYQQKQKEQSDVLQRLREVLH